MFANPGAKQQYYSCITTRVVLQNILHPVGA